MIRRVLRRQSPYRQQLRPGISTKASRMFSLGAGKTRLVLRLPRLVEYKSSLPVHQTVPRLRKQRVAMLLLDRLRQLLANSRTQTLRPNAIMPHPPLPLTRTAMPLLLFHRLLQRTKTTRSWLIPAMVSTRTVAVAA